MNSISGPIEEAKKGVGQHQGKRKGNNHGGGHNKNKSTVAESALRRDTLLGTVRLTFQRSNASNVGQVGHFKTNCPDLQKCEGQRARLYALETNPSNNGLLAPVVEAGRNIAMKGALPLSVFLLIPYLTPVHHTLLLLVHWLIG